MLRDNTEIFAPTLFEILAKLGVDDEGLSHGFQLQKFERIEPDVFIWMVRGARTYLVTIADGGSLIPDMLYLAKWSGVKAEGLELLMPEGTNPGHFPGIKDGYDYVKVYRLPKGYEHINV